MNKLGFKNVNQLILFFQILNYLVVRHYRKRDFFLFNTLENESLIDNYNVLERVPIKVTLFLFAGTFS